MFVNTNASEALHARQKTDDNMNEIVEFLKNYIWKNGFEKLSEEPFDVYKDMVNGNRDKVAIDPKTARLVMITLMSGTHEMARNGCSADEMINHIQSEHFVNKKAAKDLTFLYLALFNDENKKSWNDAKEAGFEEFCRNEWTVEWNGRCDWHIKHGGSFPCSAEGSLTFAVENPDKLHNHLYSELKSNPFLSAKDIYDILEKQIQADLDDDMQEYCDADDYYEPYFDEFVSEGTYDSESEWASWGLKIIEFSGSGYVDFKP